MSGIASAATAVLIAYIADGTRTIRAGSRGIMLLNHAPLIVAEQFGTIETLYTRRSALRRALETHAPTFADACWNFDIIPKMWKGGRLSAQIPGAGLQVPLSILGSSLFGASVSAMLGLPFAFASR